MPTCEKCNETDVVPKIFNLGTVRTLLDVKAFYDKGANYHLHDPNRDTTTYRCSNDHDWTECSVRSRYCPSCSDRWWKEDAGV